jgi:hypothetical protein
MADDDRPDQLVISLYGMLGLSMTPDTYISGEAVSLLPIDGSRFRTAFAPPNQGANSSFLETLMLMLVHERRDGRGIARGLDLGFATPRAWLEDGKSIRVSGARTSFGPVSWTVSRRGTVLRVWIALFPRGDARPVLRMRLRLPRGERLRLVSTGAGRALAFDPVTGTIELGRRRSRVDLVATVEARSQ